MPGITKINTTTLQRLLKATGKSAVEAQTPESRCVANLDYNLEEETLTIKFNQRGTYEYTNVPLDDYVDFAQSGSLGKYFNNYIRDRFSYRKIG